MGGRDAEHDRLSETERGRRPASGSCRSSR